MESRISKGLRLTRSFVLATMISGPGLITSPPALADESVSAPLAVSPNVVGEPVREPILFKEYPSISLRPLQLSPFSSKPIISPVAELKGSVAFTEQAPNPSQTIQRLVEVAVARDEQRELLDKKKKLHDKTWTKVIGRSKGMLQYATSYQGFESSSEGADVILEEKLKLKSAAAVEFVKQKRMDEAHLRLTCAVMEVATGLGLSDEGRREQAIQSGMQEMIPIVGEEEAQRTLQALTAWAKQVKVPEEGFARDPWDVLALRKKSKEMLASSLRDDDVVKSIETRLHKFNQHSNFSRATSKFVNTTLSLIAFSPTMASPAAQAAQFVYIACTGGPEEKKLLKEVYLDRCFESRFDRLSQESMLAVNNYNCAVLTRNPVLFSCTQVFIDNLTNPEFGAALTSTTVTVPEQISSHKAFGQRI